MAAFEDYRVLGLIAEGGTGRLYKARARNGDIVALKKYGVVGSVSESADVIRELSRLERLRPHPNIAAFRGITAHKGEIAVVQELVDGVTLTSLMSRPLTLHAIVAIIRQALQGLAECVHAADLVHQDLSPDNILVTADGAVKIIDFGAACMPGSRKTNEIRGTLVYSSPEQVSGDMLDPRSDLYSLGAIFYEMLAGRSPHIGSNREVHGALMRGDSIISILEIDPLLPPAIDVVISKLLADIDDRYQSASEALADLPVPSRGRDDLRAAVEIATITDSTRKLKRSRRWRHRFASGSGMLAALALLAGGLYNQRGDEPMPSIDSIAIPVDIGMSDSAGELQCLASEEHDRIIVAIDQPMDDTVTTPKPVPKRRRSKSSHSTHRLREWGAAQGPRVYRLGGGHE